MREIDNYLRGHLGVGPDNIEALCGLATTGYVVSCWRNTVLEDIHCGGFWKGGSVGSYARDGIPDTDMARLNIATWRQVRPHVSPESFDVIAVRDLLRNKDRPLRIGDNEHKAGELFAGAWTKLSWHLNEGAWLPLMTAAVLGDDMSAAVRLYAACGGAYASTWFGNPWWTYAIRAFAADEPAPQARDLDLALEAPNELSETGIRWLMRASHSGQFRTAMRAWQVRHGADHDRFGGMLLIPPGVPDLPRSLSGRSRTIP
ncbi:MAG: hypothetical protein ACRD2C_26395 [Acidimicrobiales bacterium]